nr:hypothetical protein L203_04964 [Cryptococcus depauperatus CBS 7841]
MSEGGQSNLLGNNDWDERSNAMVDELVADSEPTKVDSGRGGFLIPSLNNPSHLISHDEPFEMGQSRTHQASIPEGSRGNWTAYSNLESGAYDENNKTVLTYRNNPDAHNYLVSVILPVDRKVELQFPHDKPYLTAGEEFLSMVTGNNGCPGAEFLVPWEEHLDVLCSDPSRELLKNETRRLLLELHSQIMRSHMALDEKSWKDAERRERAA